MTEAKQLEVATWLKEAVCERYRSVIPAGRLIRMRWVLTIKGLDHQPQRGKCKARLVLLGYSDPDLLELSTAAPTMTRRSRQLVLGLATHRRWRPWKADAKAAFLQGSPRERERNILTLPVPELSHALGVPQGEAVRLVKAAYGLASAPRSWFLDVAEVLRGKCGLRQLKSDACTWIMDSPRGPIGAISLHVDDFLICGEEAEPAWQEVLRVLKGSFRWSDWENTPFVHCGVMIDQLPDYSFSLSQAEYCLELKQIDLDSAQTEGISAAEMTQARALLGATQWRVQQTAPQ